MFYDRLWGRVFVDREHAVIESLNLRPGQRVLEVGVGTGISLDAYPPYVHVVGIDPSLDMLEHAKTKIRENGWNHIELSQGDALNLDAARQQLRRGVRLPRDHRGSRPGADDERDVPGL